MKADACPGRLNQASLFVQREGTYYGQCSEIRGVNHGFMPICVRAVPLEEYISRVSSQFEEHETSLLASGVLVTTIRARAWQMQMQAADVSCRGDAGMQGMQECRNAGMQECRNAGMQECRNAGMQECNNHAFGPSPWHNGTMAQWHNGPLYAAFQHPIGPLAHSLPLLLCFLRFQVLQLSFLWFLGFAPFPRNS